MFSLYPNFKWERSKFRKQYSKQQIEWLNFLQKYYGINIQHACNDDEYRIPETNIMQMDFVEIQIQSMSIMVIIGMGIQEYFHLMILIRQQNILMVNYTTIPIKENRKFVVWATI